MLVTLGTNKAIGSGASVTFPYACKSVQKIFIKIDDTSTSGEAYSHTTTIQLGSRTICNGVSGFGLVGMAQLQANSHSKPNELMYQIDLGSHQLLDNENLYVTINALDALDAVDVSAQVDEPTGGELPVRYTEYSDNVFTAENVLRAISYAISRAAVDEDAYNIEIRNQVSSSAPSLISANNWFACETYSTEHRGQFGALVKSILPLTTTFNYSASATTNRVLVASQMGTSQRAVKQSVNAQRVAKSQVGR